MFLPADLDFNDEQGFQQTIVQNLGIGAKNGGLKPNMGICRMGYGIGRYNQHEPAIRNAFGTFSKRFVVLALLFQLLWQIAKISLSINFELRAAQTEADGGSDGQVPWFRNLLAALNWCLTGNIICCEMTSLAFAGTRASINIHAVGNLAATVAIMAVSPLQLSEFVLCVVGVTAMLLGAKC